MKRLILSLAALAAIVLTAPSPAAQASCIDRDPEKIVVCEQKKAGGAAALKDPEKIATFLKSTAATLNASNIPGGPYGVLVKTSGNRCAGYSCDIICTGNGSAQKQWDVLIDAGGRSEPTWDGPLGTIAIRTCEFVDAAEPGPQPDPEPEPEPEPVDLAPILARLAFLEDALEDAENEIENLRSEAAIRSGENRKALEEIRASIAVGGELPPYKGTGKLGWWTVTVVSRPCNPDDEACK